MARNNVLSDGLSKIYIEFIKPADAWGHAPWQPHKTSLRDDDMYRLTADYFLKNELSMNVKIRAGSNPGKLVLNTMKASTVKELKAFLDYMIVHPRQCQYAGNEWKVSEILQHG